jgi:hypothetical protein
MIMSSEAEFFSRVAEKKAIKVCIFKIRVG